jgi:hypothetical protein
METKDYTNEKKDRGLMVPKEQGDEVSQYDDYEEVGSDYRGQAVSLLQQVNEATDRLSQGLTLAQNVGSMYNDMLQLRERRKSVEAISKVKLADTVAKYKVAEQFLTNSFGERNEALQQDYKVLNDAIAKGDREMIISAMSHIGGIVTSSPLGELNQLLERFDDPDDSMLDF